MNQETKHFERDARGALVEMNRTPQVECFLGAQGWLPKFVILAVSISILQFLK